MEEDKITTASLPGEGKAPRDAYAGYIRRKRLVLAVLFVAVERAAGRETRYLNAQLFEGLDGLRQVTLTERLCAYREDLVAESAKLYSVKSKHTGTAGRSWGIQSNVAVRGIVRRWYQIQICS